MLLSRHAHAQPAKNAYGQTDSDILHKSMQAALFAASDAGNTVEIIETNQIVVL